VSDRGFADVDFPEGQLADHPYIRRQAYPENVDRREFGGPSYAGRARNGEEIEGNGRVGAEYGVRFYLR
jgi:hypothetical protein